MFSSHMLYRMCVPGLALALLLGTGHDAEARNKPCNRAKRANETVLYESKLLDVRKNTVSNVEFYTTNYGIFGHNDEKNSGGLFWPRGSFNLYLFGGGMWFGALKEVDGEMKKAAVVSYNPNSGSSWMAPGVIADGIKIQKDPEAVKKNGVYFSTDYTAEGTPKDGGSVNWPIWQLQDGTPGIDGYTGDFVTDVSQRNISVHPQGPVVLSDEDIISVYKDTDLSFNELAGNSATGLYPLGVDVVQSVYTWGDGDLKDVVILRYELSNHSPDILRDCWFSPVLDFDLATAPTQAGASNDRSSFYNDDPSLNMAYQWTHSDAGEAGKGFGYVGVSFISTPAVDAEHRLRTDKPVYSHNEQLGMATFRNWVIENDPSDNGSRYDFMSLAARDGDYGPADKRMLVATGPFDMLPGQKATVVVALVFARGSKGGECDGTTEDLAGLVELTQKTRDTYETSLQSSVVGVEEQTAAEGSLLSVNSVHPNPASSLSHVEFSLGANAETAIDIVDVTGRVVLSHREVLPAGKHVVDINAAALQQGVYMCRVAASGAVCNKTFVVVR